VHVGGAHIGLVGPLGNGWGFIELVNGMDRGTNGRGDRDEDVGNMAADYYAAWILNESDVSVWDRYFPLEHIVQIYKRTPNRNRPGSNFSDVTLG
jgi:hypothetical protein